MFPSPIKHILKKANHLKRAGNFGETFSQAVFLNAHKTDQLKHDHSQDFVIQRVIQSLTDVS